MSNWQVVAEDRTGAYEVAGLLAGTDGVLVSVGGGAHDGVIDLGTRALPADEATALARQLPAQGWVGHKMDSTLRGNWAHEVRARRLATGRRLIVLPGWPDMGRTCVAGVVKLFDEPVGAIKDYLPEAALVPHVAARTIGGAPGAVAVCDVTDTETMLGLAAAVAVLPQDERRSWPGRPVRSPRSAGMVGCASDATRSAQCRVAGVGGVRQREPDGPPTTRPAAHVAPSGGGAGGRPRGRCRPGCRPRELARKARARRPWATSPRWCWWVATLPQPCWATSSWRVGGMIAGMPWSRDAHGGQLVITKAGGFGGVDAAPTRMFPGKTG